MREAIRKVMRIDIREVLLKIMSWGRLLGRLWGRLWGKLGDEGGYEGDREGGYG